MQRMPELVMPAGDFEKLRFALAYGADAVYAGVPLYSLRARENGFSVDSLAEAISYTHQRGKKLYLTMNIFPHNSKLRGFWDSFKVLSELSPDAVIMSDIGLIRRAREQFPEIAIHLSTQANVTNWMTAACYRDFGVRRIILSRELSLKEITVFHEQVPEVELEAFVHGAICVAYSGRCLISNYLNHRDANQGTCTQSCRWLYRLSYARGSLQEVEKDFIPPEKAYQALSGKFHLTEVKRPGEQFELDEDEHGTYLMNSKDLCAIELLAELRRAGVSALKVEGRSKSLYYLAVIARAYRQALADLNDDHDFNKEVLREVMSTSSRTLMTGFLLKHPQLYGENRDDGDSLPLTHIFSGQVKSFDQQRGMALVIFRNKVSLDDTLQWFTPSKTISAPVQEIISTDGRELSSVSGGIEAFLRPPFAVDEFTLLRRPLSQRTESEVTDS